MWFMDRNFMEQIRDWWQEDQFEGSRMFCLVSKLKKIKQKIINWNKVHFKNIFQEKLEIEDKMSNLNKEIIAKGMNNESYQLEK
jgi:hypothetical protein